MSAYDGRPSYSRDVPRFVNETAREESLFAGKGIFFIRGLVPRCMVLPGACPMVYSPSLLFGFSKSNGTLIFFDTSV